MEATKTPQQQAHDRVITAWKEGRLTEHDFVRILLGSHGLPSNPDAVKVAIRVAREGLLAPLFD